MHTTGGTGSVFLSLEKLPDSIEIKLRDDGRGLSLAGIKAQAVKTGRWTQEQLDAWPPARVAALSYASDVSSRAEADIHSGRGVGMGMIRETVREIDGTMKISSSAGKFFEVQIRIAEK